MILYCLIKWYLLITFVSFTYQFEKLAVFGVKIGVILLFDVEKQDPSFKLLLSY